MYSQLLRKALICFITVLCLSEAKGMVIEMNKFMLCTLLVILFSGTALAGAAPGVPPTITQHPEDAVDTLLGSTTFSVIAIGTAPLAYQWQVFNDNTSAWNDIDGANATDFYTSPFSHPFVLIYGDDLVNLLRVVVSNSYDSVTSDIARFTIIPHPPPPPPPLPNGGGGCNTMTGGMFEMLIVLSALWANRTWGKKKNKKIPIC